jgi:hypothetical protein
MSREMAHKVQQTPLGYSVAQEVTEKLNRVQHRSVKVQHSSGALACSNLPKPGFYSRPRFFLPSRQATRKSRRTQLH